MKQPSLGIEKHFSENFMNILEGHEKRSKEAYNKWDKEWSNVKKNVKIKINKKKSKEVFFTKPEPV